MFAGRFKSLLLVAACVLASQSHGSAQSGRRQPRPLSPVSAPTPAPKPFDAANSEQFKLLVSRGLDDFVEDLNEQGRLGYRLEKSVGYGGRDEGRKYAAVLRLDPGHTYDYTHDRLPDDILYGHPFDYWARRGYNFVETYALTRCPPEDYLADPHDPLSPANSPAMKMFSTVKENVFLFMRRDRAAEQTRAYKLLTGYVGLGGDNMESLQAALDAAPPGFRPVRLLLSTPGWMSFRVSLVVERDLGERAPEKVEYRVVKEGKDFEKELNSLAATGARYVGGGRIAPYKVAVLTQQAADAGAYTFLDDDKSAQEFDRLVAAGHSYQGLMAGDLTCEADEVSRQKLVFARDATGAARRYKILSLLDPKTGQPSAAALSELQRLARDNFRLRDIFYARGLHVIMEKF